jgi:hypothetical protein
LISECEEGYSLSVDAQDIMTIGQRKKDDAEKRIYSVKENLADYHMNGEHPIIAITEAQWREVVQLHEANKKSANKSLLVPKPKPAIDKRIFPGKRKPFPSRSNKSSY